MMWMSGGGVHLFSLMMTASGLYQPLMAIAKSGDGEWGERERAGGSRRRVRCARCPQPPSHSVLFFFFSLSPNTVFPEELSEDGALDIVTPRILYCLIQVRGGWGGTWREAVPRASPS